ncbi:MAG: VWA domain-containing protein [Thermoproteota archaeon]
MRNEFISLEDLVENPTTRLPIALVLDTSGSMQGEPIRELSEGYKLFLDELKRDEVARYSAEVCVITFGGQVKVLQEFSTVERVNKYLFFDASGETPMGSAVLTALDKLEQRKTMYKETGVDYHQPWMVLMTDGQPTDRIDEAVSRVQALLDSKKLVVFPIGIGPYADLSTLAKFTTPNRPPLRLKGLSFKEFFVWLSKSVSKVSRSSPTSKIKLDENIKGWAEIG